MMEQNTRERVGVYVAAFIVFAYVAVGFVNVAIVMFKGQGIVFPSDWTASMLSLASAAFGFLVGKQMTGQNTPVSVTTQGSPPLQVQEVSTSPQGSATDPAPPVATSTSPPKASP